MDNVPPINVLIKPASSSCNMRCKYCFYFHEANNRGTPNYGIMTEETAEALIQKCLAYGQNICAFGFQGGEPTLAGLDFFKRFVELVNLHNRDHLRISYSMQTNGLLIDEQWVHFFRENDLLIGISIDGPASVHNSSRVDVAGEGTCSRVLAAAQTLLNAGVRVNVLTTVTAQVARNIRKVYRFFMSKGLVYQQYIPCLDPLESPRGQEHYSLSPEDYELFLKDLFDLWFEDRRNSRFVYVQLFENIAGLMKGIPAPVCGYLGQCSREYVIEADGSTFPCDFYMLDPYRLGNIRTDTIEQIERRREEIHFIADSREGLEVCRACEFWQTCMGGCRRNRTVGTDGRLGRFYYCQQQRRFFQYALPKIRTILL